MPQLRPSAAEINKQLKKKIQYDWCPYKKRRHTGRRLSGDGGSRDWRDASIDTRQRMPRIASKHQKLEEARKASSLPVSADTFIDF